MQTHLADFIRDTPQGNEADAILRKCVHCGFCNATCPTFQLLGDELDGPRGRIYLMKQMLEGSEVTRKTQIHLDRCLTCRNCETTCPSGVQYGKLVDIGREWVDARVERPFKERALRNLLRWVLPYRSRFTPLLRLGQGARPLLPPSLKANIPPYQRAPAWPAPRHERRMLILTGCVQPAMTPATDAAAARVLDRQGISLIRAPGGGCCGALSQHLEAPEEARRFMRANIDTWWPHIEQGAEAIVITASGCGAIVKQYGHYLQDDPEYADKAARIAAHTKDLSEVIEPPAKPVTIADKPTRIACQTPCTLQHGQQQAGHIERILTSAGYELVPTPEAHLCCGSAGTYSILQKDLAQQLLDRKLENLEANKPDAIATANIGCQMHLQTKASVPVVHWIELLART